MKKSEKCFAAFENKELRQTNKIMGGSFAEGTRKDVKTTSPGGGQTDVSFTSDKGTKAVVTVGPITSG